MRSRIVGRTYRVIASWDPKTQTVDVTFSIVDGPLLTSKEELILGNAAHRCAPIQANLISGGTDEELKYQLTGVESLEAAVTTVRRVAHSADGRLITSGFDLCSVLHDSQIGIVGIDD